MSTAWTTPAHTGDWFCTLCTVCAIVARCGRYLRHLWSQRPSVLPARHISTQVILSPCSACYAKCWFVRVVSCVLFREEASRRVYCLHDACRHRCLKLHVLR
jgi:hypothetical protein